VATRQQMLERIRQALALPPGQLSVPGDLSALPALGRVLSPVAPEDLVSRFEDELTKVGGSAYRARGGAEIANLLSRILKEGRASGVVLSRNPLLARLGVGEILQSLETPAWIWPAAAGPDPAPPDAAVYREHCFSAAAGVTGVDFALVESGSLVLTSSTEGSQLASLAPPIHIAFYLRSQVVETLEEVLAGLAQGRAAERHRAGRSVVFVTGTSRTADIEQILIRGVHGPRELHAILVED